MAPTYRSRWPIYAKQWDEAEYQAGRIGAITSTARAILRFKDRYAAVERVTSVPWYWIGPTHVRESDMDWNASLAQGDPWRRVSIHVPAGRGPFASWEAAAIDALQLDGLTRVIDFRLEKLIYFWEQFNGWGYFAHHVSSPYVWGGTSIQQAGKYVADGRWSASAWDKQLGCAAMLKKLMELDPTIRPARED